MAAVSHCHSNLFLVLRVLFIWGSRTFLFLLWGARGCSAKPIYNVRAVTDIAFLGGVLRFVLEAVGQASVSLNEFNQNEAGSEKVTFFVSVDF